MEEIRAGIDELFRDGIKALNDIVGSDDITDFEAYKFIEMVSSQLSEWKREDWYIDSISKDRQENKGGEQ